MDPAIAEVVFVADPVLHVHQQVVDRHVEIVDEAPLAALPEVDIEKLWIAVEAQPMASWITPGSSGSFRSAGTSARRQIGGLRSSSTILSWNTSHWPRGNTAGTWARPERRAWACH
jgi:hypothetical protein